MINFALGHLCFIIAFLLLRRPQTLSLLIFAAFVLLILFAGSKLRRRLDQPIALYLVYALIIAAMLSLALVQRPLVAVGALLFVISDSLIFYRMTFKTGRLSDHLCMLFYYSAQFLLALSCVIR